MPAVDHRRDAAVTSIFTTWVVLGLFLDGWAHNAGKPEDFWTPWHGVLYSGFLAGFAYFAWRRRRDEGLYEEPRENRVALLGFVLFAIAGAGDAAWHTAFGVEEDVAALLSPTHLTLMGAGLVLVTGPLRDPEPDAAASWRSFGPVAVAATLALAVVAFFLQFASPLHVIRPVLYSPGAAEVQHVAGVTHVLITNALLIGAVSLLLARWPRPPLGTFTLVLGATGLLMTGLGGFEYAELALAPALGGVAADVLVTRGASRRTVLWVAPTVTWLSWAALARATFGLGWEVELWTGAVVLAALTGLALDLLASTTTQGAATPHDRPGERDLVSPRR